MLNIKKILTKLLKVEDGTVTITGSSAGHYSSVEKMGNLVHLRLYENFNMNLPAGSIVTVGNVSEGFRPSHEVIIGGYVLGGTYGFIYVRINGDIELQRVAAGSSNLCRQNFLYFTEG